MNKYLFAVGALAVFATACTKPIGDCDTSDSGDCIETGETGDTSVEGCEEFAGTFAIGIDLDACSAPSYADVATANQAMGCDPADDTYWFEVFTIGWASNVELYIDQESNNPWHEYHNSDDMVDAGGNSEADFDADGYWSYFYLEMLNSTSISEVQSDPTKTLYVCGEGRLNSLSYFFVANSDLDSTVDCVAWGNDPAIFDSAACTAPDWI
jgi:hypothetical protein